MILAKMFKIPCLRISTIAAAADVSEELNSVAGVVTIFKALGAYHTSWVFFTVEASPCNFPKVYLFGAYTFGSSLV